MVSFRNGILRIEKNSELNNGRQYRFLYEICLYIGLVGYYIMSYPILHYGGVAAFIAGTVIITFSKLKSSRINKSLISIWYLGFIFLCELSALWSYSPEITASKYLNMLIIVLVIGFGLMQYADTRSDIERLLKIYLYAALTTMLIQFIGTPFNQWFAGYFGGYFGGVNTNTFGYILLFASVIAFNLAYNQKKRIWYFAVILFLAGCMLSSSRKAMAISVFGILSIVFFSFKRKHHFLHFFIAVIGAAAVLMLLMQNDFLYGIIGYRFSTLFNFMEGNYSSSFDSLQLRDFYINYAKELFKRHPILGNGFISFHSLLNDETAIDNVYAHNNYWEILSDLGVVGFISYYWIYIYILYKIIVCFFKEKLDNLQYLGFVMLISEIILEWGVVSMYQPFVQIIIALIYLCCCKTDGKKKFYYSKQKSGGE